jgi:hypothetical protein
MRFEHHKVTIKSGQFSGSHATVADVQQKIAPVQTIRI